MKISQSWDAEKVEIMIHQYPLTVRSRVLCTWMRYNALTVRGHFPPQIQRFTCLITGKRNTMTNSDRTLP